VLKWRLVMERDVEQYFVNEAKKQGALALKFISPGNSGVPDRLVIRSDGGVEFVELKSSTGKLRPLQTKVIKLLEYYGQTVTVISSKKEVDRYWRLRREC